MNAGRGRDLVATAACAALLALALGLLWALGRALVGAGPLGWAGFARSIAWLYPVCLLPAWHVGPTFVARYDSGALRAEPAAGFGTTWNGPRDDAQRRSWAWLQAWCLDGAGSGRAPWWQPWAMPAVDQRFGVAQLSGAPGSGKSHLAHAFSRFMDGTDRLEALTGRRARWGLKLRVKLNDCQWWRARQPSDPWDCGYLVDDATVRQRLAQFSPRRATLLIADALPAAPLSASIDMLRDRSATFRHPVRLLVIGTHAPAVPGMPTFDLTAGTR